MNFWYKRTFYLDKITAYLHNPGLIKVLIGQRRAGKSYLMKQIIDFLKTTKKIPTSNIFYINLEVEYLSYPTIQQLDEQIQNQIKKSDPKTRFYLCIDEIQSLTWREKLVNSYRANDTLDIDIFITGSNASLLSSDLSTYLAGRYIEFEILPFSYAEYLGYFNKPNSKEHFLEYLNFSGISELYTIPHEEAKLHFLKAIKDSIILKDIVKKYNVRDVDLLERLFLFLSGNIGNLFSLNSLVKKLKYLEIPTNTHTLANYINFLQKTFILHWVARYDLQWKKILEGEEKYYLNDLAFNNFFTSSYDIGNSKKLENLVYLYLRQQWYTVYIGTIGDLEIDFIAEKGKEKMHIQVAYLINDEKVFQREFGNLEKIKDNYPKIVLSLDEVLTDYQGIKHFNIWNFLYHQ